MPNNPTGTYLWLIPGLDGWSEQVLVASVAREKFLSNPEKMPTPGVTTYGQCSTLCAGEFAPQYKDYVFLKPGNLDPRQDYLTLNFGAPKTAPIAPFRTTPYTDDWSWPMIIRDLEVVENSWFPQSVPNASGGTSFANRLSLRLDGVPAIEKGTRFIKREYLSPVKFGIPRFPVPVPGMINIDFTGLQQSIPEALHGDITIPDQKAVIGTLSGSAGSNGVVPGAHYPATNFATWRPYIYPDHQEQVESGLWYRVNILLIPPRMPAPSRLN